MSFFRQNYNFTEKNLVKTSKQSLMIFFSFTAWIQKSSQDHYRPNEAIKLPLYHTNLRDKILTFVQVPSGGEDNKWLQAGTVLFLDDQI